MSANSALFTFIGGEHVETELKSLVSSQMIAGGDGQLYKHNIV